MNEEKTKTSKRGERTWKRSPKGNGKTTTVLTVNFDNDIVPHLQKAGNRSRFVNDILRKFFTGCLVERK